MTTNVELASYYMRKGAQALLSRTLRPVYNRIAPWTRVSRPEPRFEQIEPALQDLDGVEVKPFVIDPAGLQQWTDDAGYPALAYLANRQEKILEHYVSYVLLDLKKAAILVDVASCRSFFPDIMRRKGHRVIAQDLSYPPGLHGDRMGGDASRMSLANNTIGGMTLHCSFEHFENEADERFARNVAPLLEPGARVVILPLYLSHAYCIETDPLISNGAVPVDEGASLVASFGYGNRHGRHYSVPALRSRVLTPALEAGLRPSIYVIQNAAQISPACYLHFALVLEKPAR